MIVACDHVLGAQIHEWNEMSSTDSFYKIKHPPRRHRDRALRTHSITPRKTVHRQVQRYIGDILDGLMTRKSNFQTDEIAIPQELQHPARGA